MLRYRKVMSSYLSIFTYDLDYIFQSGESTYSTWDIKSTYMYLPVLDDERKKLTFEAFVSHCQYVFHIKASEGIQLEPLINIFIWGNRIY